MRDKHNDRSEKCHIINVRGGGGRGAARGGEARREGGGACRGEILTRTQIKFPSDIKTHLGGIDDGE